jgi:hypothetical protein
MTDALVVAGPGRSWFPGGLACLGLATAGPRWSMRATILVCSLLASLLADPIRAEPILVDARRFAPSSHAGTADDPWPGSAIEAAIASLAEPSGATVFLAEGIWRIDSQLVIGTNGFTLSGSNRAATIAFHGNGRLVVSSSNPHALPIESVTLTGLRVDAARLADGAPAPVNLRNCVECRVIDSYFGPRPDSGLIAVLLFEGGGTGDVSGNDFLDNYLQMNALGGTVNSGFLVSGNSFDSSGILVIGVSQISITGNTLTNRALGNFIGIRVAPPYGGVARNIRIERNTIDATVSDGNGALISGLPQDPGGKGTLRSFYIRHNTLRGSTVNINAQVGAAGAPLEDCIANCRDISDIYDVRIRGNSAEAHWGGVVIDLRGGRYGVVNGGQVFGNKLLSRWPGAVHRIITDQNTSNVTIGTNPSAQPVVIGP